MNDTFRATQRAKYLSPLAKWVVFSFGKQLEATVRNGRRIRTVEWRGERYMDVIEITERHRETRQSRIVSSGLKLARVEDLD